MTVSIWQRQFQDPHEVDVAVVGAGISGLSVAYWLEQLDPSLRVLVVDKGGLGAGASGRNAGFLTCGSIAHFARQIEARGDDEAWASWSLGRENHALLLERILGDGGCGYERKGALSLSRNPDHYDRLVAAAETLSHRGSEIQPRPIEDWPAVADYGGTDIARAWFNPEDASVDPMALLGRVAAGLAAALLVGHAGLEVRSIDTRGSRVELETDGRAVLAERVVLATNAFAPELAPSLASRLSPVRGQILQTVPAHGPRLDPTVYATDDWVYLRQLGDGSVVIGGHRLVDAAGERGTKDRLNPKVHEALESTLGTRFSALWGPSRLVARRWSGPMAYSEGGRPLIGEVPGRPNLYFLGGYSGHGMGMGFACARRLATLMVRGTRDPFVGLGLV